VSLPRYGVLKARPVAASRGPTHYHARVVADGVHYRVSINVNSQQPPSELRFIVVRPFADPLTQALSRLAPGFTPITSRAGGLALDFVRRRLFDPGAMRLLPADLPGPNNDLADLIGGLVARATRTRSDMYAFGSRWGPERRTPDRVFGFTPGNGMHDVHMNQGNHPRFERDDGVWQDGGLLLQLTEPDEWAAVFLAFQSQAWRTDDRTGHAVRRPANR
jgi:uncharacterized protein YukJ